MLAIIHFLLLNVLALSGEEGDLVKRNHILRRSPSTIRTPSEYEPVDAVILGWDDDFKDMAPEIAKAAIAGKAKVFMANGPATIKGVDEEMYKSLDLKVEPQRMTDNVPIGMIKDGNVVLGNPEYPFTNLPQSPFTRMSPHDDAFTVGLAKLTSLQQQKIPLILQGGDYMVDSKGNLFVGERVYAVNKDRGKSKSQVNALLRKHLGVNKIREVPTEGLDAKLLNDETVLISGDDDGQPDAKTMDYFKSIKAPSGKKYTILTVKAWKKKRCKATYTDSLLVNNVAIVPSYKGHEDYEKSTVKKIYQKALPGVYLFQTT